MQEEDRGVVGVLYLFGFELETYNASHNHTEALLIVVVFLEYMQLYIIVHIELKLK